MTGRAFERWANTGSQSTSRLQDASHAFGVCWPLNSPPSFSPPPPPPPCDGRPAHASCRPWANVWSLSTSRLQSLKQLGDLRHVEAGVNCWEEPTGGFFFFFFKYDFCKEICFSVLSTVLFLFLRSFAFERWLFPCQKQMETLPSFFGCGEPLNLCLMCRLFLQISARSFFFLMTDRIFSCKINFY